MFHATFVVRPPKNHTMKIMMLTFVFVFLESRGVYSASDREFAFVSTPLADDFMCPIRLPPSRHSPVSIVTGDGV